MGVVKMSDRLPELTYEEAKNLWEVLKRRRYAVLRLKQCMHYIEGYFKDFHLSIDFDQSQVNPTLVVRINIMSEIPPKLQNWVLQHVFDITERLVEVLDRYSEDILEEEEQRRGLKKVVPIAGLDTIYTADAFLKSKKLRTG